MKLSPTSDCFAATNNYCNKIYRQEQQQLIQIWRTIITTTTKIINEHNNFNQNWIVEAWYPYKVTTNWFQALAFEREKDILNSYCYPAKVLHNDLFRYFDSLSTPIDGTWLLWCLVLEFLRWHHHLNISDDDFVATFRQQMSKAWQAGLEMHVLVFYNNARDVHSFRSFAEVQHGCEIFRRTLAHPLLLPLIRCLLCASRTCCRALGRPGKRCGGKTTTTTIPTTKASIRCRRAPHGKNTTTQRSSMHSHSLSHSHVHACMGNQNSYVPTPADVAGLSRVVAIFNSDKVVAGLG
jgi:hypothetical protein